LHILKSQPFSFEHGRTTRCVRKKHECCLIINTNNIDYYYCIFVHVKLLLMCLRPHGSRDYPCPRDRVDHYLVGEMKGWSGNALIWCPSTVFLANSCSIQQNHRVHRTFIYNVLLLLISVINILIIVDKGRRR